MTASEDRLAYLAIGSFAAIVLGVALIPLRGTTTASNLAFAFLALTIAVGHAGGRGPAMATALVSALSLNFFLTRPYLTLVIHGQDDVIAFLGLASCGLISATLGSRQAVGLTKERELAVLHAALGRLELAPGESQLQAILDSTRTAFPLASIVLRDEAGRVVAFAGDRTKTDLPAKASASPAPEAESEERGSRLPREGVRLPLVAGRQAVGSLDLWGEGRTIGAESMRTLRAIAQIVAALVASSGTRAPAPEASGREPSPWLAGPRGGSAR